MRQREVDQDRLRNRLSGILLLLVTLSLVAVSFFSVAAFDRAVHPELANRTRLISLNVRNEVQRALDSGIPIDAIAGLDRYLLSTLESFSEVDRIAVTAASGRVIASVEREAVGSLLQRTDLVDAIAVSPDASVQPILHGNRLVGDIRVEISPHFVQTRLREVFLDVVVIALIATLIALELALAVAVSSVGKPLARLFRQLTDQRDGDFLYLIRPGGLGGLGRAAARFNDHVQDLAERLQSLPASARAAVLSAAGARIPEGGPNRLRLSTVHDIRLALFFYSVSAEIASAFLPLYARAAARPEWLTSGLAAAAPLAVYLLALALLSPFAGSLAQRFGARRLFLASVPPTALALLAMGFSDSILAVTLLRGAMGLSYGLATIACQEYAIRSAADRGSAQPVGTFVAVVYSGVFCGSAMGGVVADRFGFASAFALGALVALLAGLLGLATMRGRAGDRAVAESRPPRAEAGRGWLNLRLLALFLGIAVPMNAATAIFVWYLTPLMLANLGSGTAEIARVVMLYYLAVVVFGPLITSLSDRRAGPVPLVLLGALLSAVALLSLGLWGGFWAILVAVAGLGLGHTLIRAPLFTLALRMGGGSAAGMNLLRSLERVGAMLGLTASALLLGRDGPEGAIAGLGIVVLAGGLFYSLVEAARRFRSG